MLSIGTSLRCLKEVSGPQVERNSLALAFGIAFLADRTLVLSIFGIFSWEAVLLSAFFMVSEGETWTCTGLIAECYQVEPRTLSLLAIM